MMERLTKQEQDFEYQFCSECVFYGEPNGCNAFNGGCKSYYYFTETAERLRKYEDAEEAGLLVRLPCKVDDIVYVCSGCIPSIIKTWGVEKSLDYDVIPKYFAARVVSFRFSTRKYVKLAVAANHVTTSSYTYDDAPNEIKMGGEFCKWNFPLSSFGKTIFLTKEEAEQALKEVQE